MEERIEKIIENIEISFNQLNNSVELLKKAEESTTKATKTSSKLITEFQTTISSIEKLIKTDFANEYNKLYDSHKKLIEKVDKINFETKFQEVNSAIANKNYDTKFREVNTKIDNVNFDQQFTSTNNLITEKSSEILRKQNKEFNILKKLLMGVVLLIIIGTIATILVLK